MEMVGAGHRWHVAIAWNGSSCWKRLARRGEFEKQRYSTVTGILVADMFCLGMEARPRG